MLFVAEPPNQYLVICDAHSFRSHRIRLVVIFPIHTLLQQSAQQRTGKTTYKNACDNNNEYEEM